jgi:hypothetical protein
MRGVDGTRYAEEATLGAAATTVTAATSTRSTVVRGFDDTIDSSKIALGGATLIRRPNEGEERAKIEQTCTSTQNHIKMLQRIDVFIKSLQ